MIFARAQTSACKTLQQSGYTDAQLYDPRDTSVARHARLFSDPGRTGSLRTACETAGSNNLPEVRVDIRSRHGNRGSDRDVRSLFLFCLTNMPGEQRLEELRRQALDKGIVADRGVDIAGGPIPRKPGYYGEPVVRPPVWTWEIPVYFFVGGLSGMAAVLAFAALVFHQTDLVRAAMWLAGFGAIISPILLVMDLGRPHLFLNMLRIFKPQSPMSVGAWILTMFGSVAVPGVLAIELSARHVFGGELDHLVHIFADLCIIGSAFWGMWLATYTGVLLGATAIPAWFLHRLLLPIHFGTAGLGSAAATLELLGYRGAALNAIGLLAAGIESLLWVWLEIDRHGAADRALHEGGSGWLIRSGELCSGPLALVLRLTNLTPFAAAAFLLGALLGRFGWIAAGRVSGKDPEAVFASQKI